MHKMQLTADMLRLHLAAQPSVDEALRDLLLHVTRMRLALEFYANRENYIDGAPQVSGVDDNGVLARYALGLDDYVLGSVIRIPEQVA